MACSSTSSLVREFGPVQFQTVFVPIFLCKWVIISVLQHWVPHLTAVETLLKMLLLLGNTAKCYKCEIFPTLCRSLPRLHENGILKTYHRSYLKCGRYDP